MLDFLWVLSGRIFGARIFGGKKVYQVSDFDEIIINRADRLGDAIISRPFLALFARYIRQNYPAMPKIKVIASGYNLEFLTSLASDDIMVEAAPGVTTYDYDRSVWYALKKLALGFIMGFSRFGKTKNRIAFVDLVDSVTE